jgi:hypothetical protein
MASLIHQRCFNHALREAAARCPECGHFYCRECITEHGERVICAACLKTLAKAPFTQRRALLGVLRIVQCLAGAFAAWLFFYFVGQTLLSIDSSFHEGTLWQNKWLDQE